MTSLSIWRCWSQCSRLDERGVGLLCRRNPVLEGRHGWKVTPLTKNTKKDDILNLGNLYHLLYRMRMATRTRFWLAGKMSTPLSVEQVQVQVEQMLPLSTSSLGPAFLSSSLSGSGSCWGEVGIFQLSGSAQGLKHCRLYSQTTLWKFVSALVWLLLPRRHAPSDIATLWVPIPTYHAVVTLDHGQLFNLIIFTSKTINSRLNALICEAKWESTIWVETLQISMSSLSFEVEIPQNDQWHVYIYMYICVHKW